MDPREPEDTGQNVAVDDEWEAELHDDVDRADHRTDAHDDYEEDVHGDDVHDDQAYAIDDEDDYHDPDDTDTVARPERGAKRQPDGRKLPAGQRMVAYARRHRIQTGVFIVLLPLFLLVSYSWGQAMTKDGSESFLARNVQWLRDNHFDFLVDRVEQKWYEGNQPEAGGQPDVGIGLTGPETGNTPSTPAPAGNATVVTIPHTPAPEPVKTPAAEPLPDEGKWFPAGPDLGGGVHGVYYTKVRPNETRTSLLVFEAWMDPKVVDIKQYPGTELPGGKWTLPNSITPDVCPQAILAVNGGFRMEASRGGWYMDGREQQPLQNNAASLVFYKDGHVDVQQFGRYITRNDLGQVTSIRQNLELLVDNGAPVANIDTNNWGALLPNSYFVWRSGYGITKDGALLFIGGPGLTPRDLAQRFIDAGAVRAMEGDINPEWVTANFYTVGEDGKCTGSPGLSGSQD